MFDTILPTRRYSLADYPNMNPDRVGDGIPIRLGDIHDIMGVCINVNANKWNFGDHELLAIDEVRAGGVVLTPGTDYTANLVTAEITINGTPWLEPATMYYLVFEPTFAVDGVNYLTIAQNWNDQYPAGQKYLIDNLGAWAADGANDIIFQVWGRHELSAAEDSLMVDFWIWDDGGGGSGWNMCNLRAANANYRLGQSFVTPADAGFYLTKVTISCVKVGAPVGNLYLSALSAYLPAEVQIGADSLSAGGGLGEWDVLGEPVFWRLLADVSEVRADIRGYPDGLGSYVNNVADVIYDLVVRRIGADPSVLKPGTLAALKAARTEELAVNIETETTFGQVIAKLEAAQRFLFQPDIGARQYTVTVFGAGTPAGTPHLRDEDIVSFSLSYDPRAVRRKVMVLYDQTGSSGYRVAEAEDEAATWRYKATETLTLETYFKQGAAALACAQDYLRIYGASLPAGGRLMTTLEEQSYLCWGRMPGDKVKISRERAAFCVPAGDQGTMIEALFRVLRVTRSPKSKTCTVDAIYDPQTY